MIKIGTCGKEDQRGFHYPVSGLGKTIGQMQVVKNQLQIVFSFSRVWMS